MNTGCFGCSAGRSVLPMMKAPLGRTTISGQTSQSLKTFGAAGGCWAVLVAVCAQALDPQTDNRTAVAIRTDGIKPDDRNVALESVMDLR